MKADVVVVVVRCRSSILDDQESCACECVDVHELNVHASVCLCSGVGGGYCMWMCMRHGG